MNVWKISCMKVSLDFMTFIIPYSYIDKFIIPYSYIYTFIDTSLSGNEYVCSKIYMQMVHASHIWDDIKLLDINIKMLWFSKWLLICTNSV